MDRFVCVYLSIFLYPVNLCVGYVSLEYFCEYSQYQHQKDQNTMVFNYFYYYSENNYFLVKCMGWW